MSKISAYLQEHILGEVSISPTVRTAYSHDAGILTITPEIVIYPRVTNDIRKVARFCWQLAEKGHVLAITSRGGGSDETGAATGAGAVIALGAHMDRLLEVDAKQKLVRVQPGMNAGTLSDILATRSLCLPSLPLSARYSTIGGAVANNATSPTSGRYGDTRAYTYELEVVLASGDVLQTSRLSKRDLSKKRGMQTFEGELYRQLDDLIENNRALIEEKLATDVYDGTGYAAITEVKRRDGSFDLTPLIVGSQGTLGVVSEMILRVDNTRPHTGIAAICFASAEAARDMLDRLRALEPSALEYYDNAYFDVAADVGRKYVINQADAADFEAVVMAVFEDAHEHGVTKRLKKVQKLCSGDGIVLHEGVGDNATALQSIREVTHFMLYPEDANEATPPLFDNVYIPAERFEDFLKATNELAKKHHVALPIYGDTIQNLYSTRPVLDFKKVGDKQKLLKLLDDFAATVAAHNGHLIGRGGEGRVKAHAAWAELDPEIAELYKQIKNIFDPYHLLNPGVKEPNELKTLVSQLRPNYDLSEFAGYSPYK